MQRQFFMAFRQIKNGARFRLDMSVDNGGIDFHRRSAAIGAAQDQTTVRVAQLESRQVIRAMVMKLGLDLLAVFRQSDPDLNAVHEQALGAGCLARAFRMGDALAGCHPVHIAWIDGLVHAQTIAMVHLTVKQIGDGRQPDMRVGAHIDAFAGAELRRAHLVVKDEGTDMAALCDRQDARDAKPAQILALAFKNVFKRAHQLSSGLNGEGGVSVRPGPG
jgi:hypothetical protein